MDDVDQHSEQQRLKAVHKIGLKSQGNIYTFKNFEETHLIIGQLQKKIQLLKLPPNGSKTRLWDLKSLCTSLPSISEIISIEAFPHKKNITFVVAFVESCEDYTKKFFLQLFRTGGNVTGLQNETGVSSVRLELSYVPYHLTYAGNGHCLVTGGDYKIHVLEVNNLNQIKEVDSQQKFPEFVNLRLTAVARKIHFYQQDAHIRWTAIAQEDGVLHLLKIDESKLASSYTRTFEGISDVEFYVNGHAVNLAVASTLDVSAVFTDIATYGLSTKTELDRSNEFDVVTCCLTTPTHIFLGTYGQEILAYDSQDLKLLWQHSINHPILSIKSAQQNTIAVMTNKTVEFFEC